MNELVFLRKAFLRAPRLYGAVAGALLFNVLSQGMHFMVSMARGASPVSRYSAGADLLHVAFSITSTTFWGALLGAATGGIVAVSQRHDYLTARRACLRWGTTLLILTFGADLFQTWMLTHALTSLPRTIRPAITPLTVIMHVTSGLVGNLPFQWGLLCLFGAIWLSNKTREAAKAQVPDSAASV